MSLNKAIEHKKEHRKNYIGKDYCKSVDSRCCNHGGCPYCEGNRLHKYNVEEEKKYEIIEEWLIQQRIDGEDDENE